MKTRKEINAELSGLVLTKSMREEFDNIAKNQPVFSGNVISKQESRKLILCGLVMYYEGEYVLTDKGTALKENLAAATKIRDSGVLYNSPPNK